MADGGDVKMEVETTAKSYDVPASAFSESAVIDTHLDVPSTKTESIERMVEVYEIERSVQVITSSGFNKVALQFPDSLLADSASVARLIEQRASCKAFILADTSYGSCCVDEIAAEHADAELIIHYGQACLSQTKRLPVLYVFGKNPINVIECSQHFRQLYPDTGIRVLVFYDVVYNHCIGALDEALSPLYPNMTISTIAPEGLPSEPTSQQSSRNPQASDVEGMEVNQCNRRFGRDFTLAANSSISDYQIFYIGEQSLTLRNLMMTYNKCQFSTYDPITNESRRETLNVNKALMKRYHMIQRAKDAQIVGIVVGTLGVADYLKIIERLKKVLAIAGKKSYVFVMGKLNVAKLANFLEIDVFVLVSCPENSLIDSKEFYKPVVTPYEMEIACLRTQEWTGDYVTDFHELLPGGCYSAELNSEDDNDDSPYISLITGKMQHNYKSSAKEAGETSTSLVQRNQETTLATQQPLTAGEFLASRSWQGLQQNLGDTPVTTAVEGRRGIAAGYTDEGE
ncbi:2-(3-amino-3-carboxypropyl)histidine synthase subunit 2 [Nematostella vectensis]|uniref:2-(3-amino-3-carboxypropyl)histidine synthase subunit 2 n=1 Tax=Nematostella vectensis TaxID=45351 RepID=UPI0013900EF9|nr:2-(3-amino-3-carboxypropyl)histidine synthase subunit 2 [Nematostella vectensis]